MIGLRPARRAQPEGQQVGAAPPKLSRCVQSSQFIIAGISFRSFSAGKPKSLARDHNWLRLHAR
jgi:hypothetical protein